MSSKDLDTTQFIPTLKKWSDTPTDLEAAFQNKKVLSNGCEWRPSREVTKVDEFVQLFIDDHIKATEITDIVFKRIRRFYQKFASQKIDLNITSLACKILSINVSDQLQIELRAKHCCEMFQKAILANTQPDIPKLIPHPTDHYEFGMRLLWENSFIFLQFLPHLQLGDKKEKLLNLAMINLKKDYYQFIQYVEHENQQKEPPVLKKIKEEFNLDYLISLTSSLSTEKTTHFIRWFVPFFSKKSVISVESWKKLNLFQRILLVKNLEDKDAISLLKKLSSLTDKKEIREVGTVFSRVNPQLFLTNLGNFSTIEKEDLINLMLQAQKRLQEVFIFENSPPVIFTGGQVKKILAFSLTHRTHHNLQHCLEQHDQNSLDKVNEMITELLGFSGYLMQKVSKWTTDVGIVKDYQNELKKTLEELSQSLAKLSPDQADLIDNILSILFPSDKELQNYKKHIQERINSETTSAPLLLVWAAHLVMLKLINEVQTNALNACEGQLIAMSNLRQPQLHIQLLELTIKAFNSVDLQTSKIAQDEKLLLPSTLLQILVHRFKGKGESKTQLQTTLEEMRPLSKAKFKDAIYSQAFLTYLCYLCSHEDLLKEHAQCCLEILIAIFKEKDQKKHLELLQALAIADFFDILVEIKDPPMLDQLLKKKLDEEIGEIHVPDFNKKFIATFGSIKRHPHAFLIYFGSLQRFQGPNLKIVQKGLRTYLKGVLNESYSAIRYDIQQSPHLAICCRDIKTLTSWRENKILENFNFIREPDPRILAWKVIDTDDPIDLLLCGTDIMTCQNIKSGQFNQGLLGYLLNGRCRMIAVKEKDEIIGRVIIKLLIDQNQQPVFFVEQMYAKAMPPKIAEAIGDCLVYLCCEKARTMNIPLVLKSNDSNLLFQRFVLMTKEKPVLFTGHIQALKDAFPFEYSDATANLEKDPSGFIISGGSFDRLFEIKVKK